jgi:hypothetical protein
MSYPDDMNWAAFDRAQGRDDDGDEARAVEAMAYAKAELAKLETVRAILLQAVKDIEDGPEAQPWPGGYAIGDVLADMINACRWDTNAIRDRLFAKKMDELEGRG